MVRPLVLSVVSSLLFVNATVADVVVTDYEIQVVVVSLQGGLDASGCAINQSANGGTASYEFIGGDEAFLTVVDRYLLSATSGYNVNPSAGHLLTFKLANSTADPLTAGFQIEGTANFNISGVQTDGDFNTNAVVGWEDENGLVDFAVFNPSSTTNTSVTGDFPELSTWEVVVPSGQTIDIEVTPAVVTFGGCEIPLGDMNQDGTVDLLDISLFVDVLSNGGFQREADMNQDRLVNLLDVSLFVAALSGG